MKKIKHHNTVFQIRLPETLLATCHEIAAQSDDKLARVVRRHLEAYAASQPLKTAKNN